jgi:hypothetical protein
MFPTIKLFFTDPAFFAATLKNAVARVEFWITALAAMITSGAIPLSSISEKFGWLGYYIGVWAVPIALLVRKTSDANLTPRQVEEQIADYLKKYGAQPVSTPVIEARTPPVSAQEIVAAKEMKP